MKTHEYILNDAVVTITDGYEREDFIEILRKYAPGTDEIADKIIDDIFYTKQEMQVILADSEMAAESYRDRLIDVQDELYSLSDRIDKLTKVDIQKKIKYILGMIFQAL